MSTDPKLITLPEITMHAPIETRVTIHVRLPDGARGSLTVMMEPGQIPTRASILAVLGACLSPESMAASSIPAGTRLLTKPEFVEVITRRETGQATPMDGSQEYVPAPTEIPKAMLVHAIAGADFPTAKVAEEYHQRGLAEHTIGSDPGWHWDAEALAELPADMLLTIYKRIA